MSIKPTYRLFSITIFVLLGSKGSDTILMMQNCTILSESYSCIAIASELLFHTRQTLLKIVQALQNTPFH